MAPLLEGLVTDGAATVEKCVLHPSSSVTFCDIGANLTDPVFAGMYRGKQKHESDFDLVLERAMEAGVAQVIVTAGNLEESRAALELVKAQRSLPQAQQARQARLYCTVGVHPTRCDEFEAKAGADAANAAEAHLIALKELCDAASADAAASGGDPMVVAVGECGLDSNVLRKDFSNFPIGDDEWADQISLVGNTSDIECQLCKVVRGTSRCYNCTDYTENDDTA